MKKKSGKLKYILIGGGIGLITGVGSLILFVFLLSNVLVVRIEGIYYQTLGLPYVLSEAIPTELDWCSGWNCLGFFLFGGTIIYILLGMLIGYLIYKLKKK